MPLIYIWLKTQDKAIDNCSCALEFVLDSYKIKKICNKAVNTYSSAMQFIPECFKTKDACDKEVYVCHFVIDSFPDQY